MAMTFRVLTTALLVVVCLQHHTCARRIRRDPAIPSDERFNFFDFELIQEVAEAAEGNVVVSPASVKATLAMLLEAAGGRTAEEIQKALRIPAGRSAQAFLQAYLSTFKERSSGYKLELSNRVFTSKSLTASQRYADALNTYYYAGIESVDFTRPEKAANNINKWVRDVTHNLIPELVNAGSLSPMTQAVVANAVYFKGVWKVSFPPSNTQPRCFQARPGVCINADMMEEMDEYRYGYVSKLDAHAVELPYKGDKFAMLLLLPKSVSGIDQLVHDIAHAHMSDIVDVMETTEVLLSIPRFAVDYSVDLVTALRDLNIREVFSPNANLTGMFSGTETTATVSNIFHKAKIIVNEEGSEAAAGTGALVVPLMGTTIQTFRADHPFLWFIRDVTTNAVLFAGRLSAPDAVRPRPQDADVQSIFSSTPPPRRKPAPTTEGYYKPQSPTQRPITSQGSFIHPDAGQTQYKPQQRPVERPTSTFSNTNPSQTQYENPNQPQRPAERPTSTGSNPNPSQTQYQNPNSQQRPAERPTSTLNSNPNPSQTQYQNPNPQQRPTERPASTFSNTNPSQTQYQNPNPQQRPTERPTITFTNNQNPSQSVQSRPVVPNYNEQQTNYQSNGQQYSPSSSTQTLQNSASISDLQNNGQQQQVVPLGLSAIQPQQYIPPQTPVYYPNTRFVQNSPDTRPSYRGGQPVQSNEQYTPPPQPTYHHQVYTSAGNSLQGDGRGRVPAQTSAPTYAEAAGVRTVYQPPPGHNADAIVFVQRINTDE